MLEISTPKDMYNTFKSQPDVQCSCKIYMTYCYFSAFQEMTYISFSKTFAHISIFLGTKFKSLFDLFCFLYFCIYNIRLVFKIHCYFLYPRPSRNLNDHFPLAVSLSLSLPCFIFLSSNIHQVLGTISPFYPCKPIFSDPEP